MVASGCAAGGARYRVGLVGLDLLGRVLVDNLAVVLVRTEQAVPQLNVLREVA